MRTSAWTDSRIVYPAVDEAVNGKLGKKARKDPHGPLDVIVQYALEDHKE